MFVLNWAWGVYQAHQRLFSLFNTGSQKGEGACELLSLHKACRAHHF
jgi:hypothetical protein